MREARGEGRFEALRNGAGETKEEESLIGVELIQRGWTGPPRLEVGTGITAAERWRARLPQFQWARRARPSVVVRPCRIECCFRHAFVVRTLRRVRYLDERRARRGGLGRRGPLL